MQAHVLMVGYDIHDNYAKAVFLDKSRAEAEAKRLTALHYQLTAQAERLYGEVWDAPDEHWGELCNEHDKHPTEVTDYWIASVPLAQ
jgi:hypothetical protein